MALNINNSLALPDDQWFHNSGIKTGICLHHTVGGTAVSSLNWWKQDPQPIGTAFIIERDGSVFQAFDPLGWAYQFGLKWPHSEKIPFEKRFIGIEIASEGGLQESGGNFYCFDRIGPRTLKNKDEVFDFGKPYRGYRYFDRYETAQVNALLELLNHLFRTFNIEKKIPKDYMQYHGKKLKDFNGVIGHVNVREDKTDPLPDDSFWQRVIKESGLELVDLENTGTAGSNGNNILSAEEIAGLFQENLVQFNKMNRSAGSMIKGLLWELQDDNRNTYIRLRDAVEGGHKVFYDLVQGDSSLLAIAAQSLGFKKWDSNCLEVFDA
jgi:hypothetical protein